MELKQAVLKRLLRKTEILEQEHLDTLEQIRSIKKEIAHLAYIEESEVEIDELIDDFLDAKVDKEKEDN